MMKTNNFLSLSLILLVCVAILIVVPLWTSSISFSNIQDMRNGWEPMQYPVTARIGLEDFVAQNLRGWHSPIRALSTLVFLYLGGVITMLFSPKRVRRVADELRLDWKKRLRILAVGFLGLLSILALAFLGFLSVFGAPLSLLLLILVMLGFWVGWMALALVLGDWLVRKIGVEKSSPLLSFGLGLLVIQTLATIPIIGWASAMFLALFGFGAVLSSKIGTEGGWSLKELSNG